MQDDYFTRGEKEFLLKIARAALEKQVKEDEKFEPQTVNQKLWEKQGVLVALYKNNILRGQAETKDESESLLLAIRDAVISAAKDLNFPPIETGELAEIKIEISIGDFQKSEVVVFKEGEI